MKQFIIEGIISTLLLTLSLYLTAAHFDHTEYGAILYYSIFISIYLIFKNFSSKIIYVNIEDMCKDSAIKYMIFTVLLLFILHVTANEFDEAEFNSVLLFAFFAFIQSVYRNKTMKFLPIKPILQFCKIP